MRAARLVSMVLLLQARGVMTAAELAAELEVSERTVYRDALALAESGIPVYADRGRAGGYRLLGGYRTRLTGLNRAEAEALFLSGLPGPLRDMGLGGAALAAQLKVAAALTPELRDAPTTASQRFHLDAPAWFKRVETPPWLPALAEAVWLDRVVTASYQRGGRALERVLEPQGLVLKAGVWYLVARSGERLLVYRVDRFARVAVGEKTFSRDESLDLAAFWAARSAQFARSLLAATATVRLEPRSLRRLPGLDPAVAEEVLAAASESDAEGWVTVELPVESLEVAFHELLALGPDVEVLGPSELRCRMAEATARAARRYAEPGGGAVSHERVLAGRS